MLTSCTLQFRCSSALHASIILQAWHFIANLNYLLPLIITLILEVLLQIYFCHWLTLWSQSCLGI